MNFITATYWQSARNNSTLLLQQYQYKHTPLCLITLCDGQNEDQGKAGAYLTGQLLQWFRGLPFSRLIRDPDRSLSTLETQLENLLSQLRNDLISCGLLSLMQALPLSGIFCFDDMFLIFGKRNHPIYLLNKGFGQSRIQNLYSELISEQDSSDSLVLRQGILQQDVGILFVTETLCGQLTEQEIQECMYVEEIHTEDQVNRHLQELGSRAEGLGGRNMAAAFLLVRC